MDNMESILTSVKKMLGPTEEQTHFDVEIITHINSVLSDLASLGVGPSGGFSIEDSTSTWDEFFDGFPYPDLLNNVKTYVYLRVKLVFDPPMNSSVLKSYEQQADKLEWKINATVDPKPQV